jgi:NADH-quinone oxidoreductase subunit M
MLVAILYVYFAHQQGGAPPSALLSDLLHTNLSHEAQLWLFAAFALAFAIKVPMLPFHTWLPDAHVEAPTGGSVILAGVLLKMGTYGFLRWAMPLFPEAAFAFRPVILSLAAIGVVYGALVALVQPDMKRMIAYSSVSHLGFVMLGLFAVDRATGWPREAVTGAVLQMVNHGLSTGALFLLVGVLYERRHTREIAQFGGLAQRMPMYAAILLFVTLSSIGLPGLNGFVGEFLILIGTWKVAPVAAGVAASGVVLGAVYMLWLYQRVALGRVTRPENEHIPDATLGEVLYLAPVLAAILFIGLYPQPLLTRIAPAVDSTLTHMEDGAGIGSGAPETAGIDAQFAGGDRSPERRGAATEGAK